MASNIIKTCEELSDEFQAHADSMESVQVTKLVTIVNASFRDHDMYL